MDRIGPYVIDRKLGTGGMGTVYLAVHEDTGEQTAVKVLPASLAGDPVFRIRFKREIDALRQIDNPHVVQIYDSGTVTSDGELVEEREVGKRGAGKRRLGSDETVNINTDESRDPDDAPDDDGDDDRVDDGDGEPQAYYYAMEFVDGETLLSLLRREGRLPWTIVVDYGVQICSALKAAHNAGIIHRDLKPSNLLVSKDGNVKLADFGVAQIFASVGLTKSGGIIGTAEFMSPEQAQGQRATKKSDLYALGAVLYTMLTGKPPYSGQTMLDVMHKHRFGLFDRPRHFAPDCPSWLEEIVCQLLEKDPDKRPADAYVTGKQLRSVPRRVELSRSDPLPASVSNAVHVPPTGQEILSHDDGPDAAVDAVTRTAPGLDGDESSSRRGPGEATLMHSLMRQELERQQKPHPVQAFLENTWVLVGLLSLLLLGGWVWYQNLPTPEWHWAEAERLIAEGDYSTARTEHLQPLVGEGGDWEIRAKDRIAETRQLEKAIGRDRTIRTNQTTEPAVRAGSLAEVRRLLRAASIQRDVGDLDGAVATLDALLAVTAHDDAFAIERKQAATLRDALRKPTAEGDGRTELIRDSLARAAALETQDPAAAETLYRGLIALYGNDPAVAKLLEPARQKIDE